MSEKGRISEIVDHAEKSRRAVAFVEASLDAAGLSDAADRAFRQSLLFGSEAGLLVWDEWCANNGIPLPESMRERWREVWR